MRSSGFGRRGLLALAGAGAVAACSSGDDSGLPAHLERIKPTDVPTPTLSPRAVEPIDSRRVQGPRFSLWIPSPWTDRELSAPEGLRMFAYDASGRPPERPARIGVVVEDPAATEAIEQSQALVAAKTAADATDIRRSMIAWTGALYAVLVDWVEAPGGEADLPFRTRQLMLQVASDAIVNVLAIAPADEFEQLELDDIVSTVTIESS